jgi:hypothetical protein
MIKKIIACAEQWKVKCSDKQRKLMVNQTRQDRPRVQKKIKEMPVGCLKGNRARQYRPRLQATPRKVLKRNASWMSSDTTVGLEEKCQTGIHKSSGEIEPPENSRDAS